MTAAQLTKFNKRLQEGYNLPDTMYHTWKKYKLDTSNPTSSNSDVLIYPKESLKPNRKSSSDHYFIISSDEAYKSKLQAAVLKRKREEEKNEKKLMVEQKKNLRLEETKLKSVVKKTKKVVVSEVEPSTSRIYRDNCINTSVDSLEIGDYVAIEQEGLKGLKHLYFGRVEEMSCNNLRICFLEQLMNKNLFVWTEHEIIEDHPVESSIGILTAPEKQNQRLQLAFKESEYKQIKDIYSANL
ncbi:uncharacterized protein LOC141901083 [Tubulanus polymorphus]|uniref:uncharacterized protein LOC141901083 n=1 Tax=Tubulanus polymorphus TaxID=672921 RepID=UPI003DA2BBB7